MGNNIFDRIFSEHPEFFKKNWETSYSEALGPQLLLSSQTQKLLFHLQEFQFRSLKKRGQNLKHSTSNSTKSQV